MKRVRFSIAFVAAAISLAAMAPRVSAQEVLGPHVQEAIKQIEQKTRKIDAARRHHRERVKPLEKKRMKLERKIRNTRGKAPESVGKTDAEYLEVALLINIEDMKLVEQTLEALEALAEPISRIQEAVRRTGTTPADAAASVLRVRRMVKGLLTVGSRILQSSQVSSNETPKLRQLQNTLLVMRRVYREVLNPKARATLAVQLDTLVHTMSATFAQTQALRDLLQDQRARLAIANNMAMARLLALKMGRLGGKVKALGADLGDTARSIIQRNRPINRMIEREAGMNGHGRGFSLSPEVREMAQGNVF